MVEQDDEILVRQALKGDKDSFSCLVERYQKPMFNVAFRITNDYDDASDVTQAAFIKAYENLRQFNPRYKFYSWLYRITINGSLNFINGRGRQEELSENIVSSEHTPLESSVAGDTSRIVQKAMMQLSSDYRAVVVLSHFQDMSYKEIADVLEIPENTVKSRLFSARQLLKGILVKKGMRS